MKVKKGNKEHRGDYYLGHYYTEATRNVHGQPNTWPVYDERTEPEWYDDAIAEFDYLSEAKAYMIERTEQGV